MGGNKSEREKLEDELLATIAELDELKARYDKLKAEGALDTNITFLESE